MREIDEGLKYPFESVRTQFIQKQGKSYLNDNAPEYFKKSDIQGIPDGYNKVALGKDLSEIRQTYPGGTKPKGDIIPLKSNYDAV
jgi:hypothetical protein